jgi:hypothetical protein
MLISWSELKSRRLKKSRGMSFEEVLGSKLIGVLKHPAREDQNILLFEKGGYVWVVPYVHEKGGIFLKTLFPSRKYTKRYGRKKE